VDEVGYDRDVMVQVFIYHQRLDIGTCLCGWGAAATELGKSHAHHIADVYEHSMRLKATS